ncbi:MAG TPA: hypothetical protein VGM09_00990, partial [Bradyrhizobium sp.]
MFPKPGQTELSQKWAYVKKVTLDGVPGLVASGCAVGRPLLGDPEQLIRSRCRAVREIADHGIDFAH